MPLVSIIVPYFQREAGLLAAALRSVAAQSVLDRGAAPAGPGAATASPPEVSVEVIVVDDGSPLPARAELCALEMPAAVTVRLFEQDNRGASAARNRGLDEVDPGTSLLAFLDSDDEWRPEHLGRAIRAHALGADLYTSNWIPAETDVDAFSHFEKLDLADHRPLAELEDAYEFQGDFMAQEMRGSIARPSAMVVRWGLCRDLRFDPRLLYASEDQLWRLALIARRPRVVFSSRPEVTSGRGVGLFSGARWGTERGMLVLVDRIRCMNIAARELPLTDDARAVRARAVERARLDLAAVALHLLRARRPPRPRSLWRIAASDPLMLLLWPRYVWAAGRKRRQR